MRFMLTIDVVVPPESRPEAAALRDSENAYVDQQLESGALEAVYFEDAAPVRRLWAVMRADSLDDAQRQVDQYPMHQFFQSTYTPLR